MASDRLGPWAFTRSLAWSWVGLIGCAVFLLLAIFVVVVDLVRKPAENNVASHAVMLLFFAVFTFRFTLNVLWVRREIAREYIAAHATDAQR